MKVISPEIMAIAKAILFLLRYVEKAPMGEIGVHHRAMTEITGTPVSWRSER